MNVQLNYRIEPKAPDRVDDIYLETYLGNHLYVKLFETISSLTEIDFEEQYQTNEIQRDLIKYLENQNDSEFYTIIHIEISILEE